MTGGELADLALVIEYIAEGGSLGEIGGLETRLAHSGRWAQGPINTMLGRIRLELGQLDRAIGHFRRAEALGYQSPDLALGLGRALTLKFREAKGNLAMIRDPRTRELRLAELVREYRDPALASLGRARTLDPERDLVLSLIAELEGRALRTIAGRASPLSQFLARVQIAG